MVGEASGGMRTGYCSQDKALPPESFYVHFPLSCVYENKICIHSRLCCPGPLGLGSSTGTGRGSDLGPLNTLNPGSWSGQWQPQTGQLAEGGQGQAWRVPVPERGHLGSSALPPHSSPLSQACLAVGAPPPPPLVLEWGRLRPHPMEDVAKTVHTHAHKCVNGLGSGDSLPHSSLSPGSGKPQSGGFM